MAAASRAAKLKNSAQISLVISSSLCDLSNAAETQSLTTNSKEDCDRRCAKHCL